MNQISETLLLTVAQVAATLLGLLIVAALFYIETGLRRLSTHNPEVRSYLRSTTKAIVALYGFALVVAFALVVLHSAWASLLYALGAAYVVVVMAEWTLNSRSIRALVHVRRLSPWLAWPMFLIPLIAPWLIDGWMPDARALTLGLLLVLALAFINTGGLLMLAFDFASYGEQVEAREAASAIGGAWLLDVFRDAPVSRDVGRVGRLAGAARASRRAATPSHQLVRQGP